MSAFSVLLRALAKRTTTTTTTAVLVVDDASFSRTSSRRRRRRRRNSRRGGDKKESSFVDVFACFFFFFVFFFFFEQLLRRGKGRAQKKIDKQNALPRETERVSRTRRGRRGVGREKFERENDERFVFDSIGKVFGRGKSDLYSYLTGQSEAPKYLREENEAYKALKAHVMKFLDEKSDEKTRAKFGEGVGQGVERRLF